MGIILGIALYLVTAVIISVVIYICDDKVRAGDYEYPVIAGLLWFITIPYSIVRWVTIKITNYIYNRFYK